MVVLYSESVVCDQELVLMLVFNITIDLYTAVLTVDQLLNR